MNNDIYEMLEGFFFEYTPEELLNYLYPMVLVNHFTLLALKDLVINKLSLYTGEPLDKLEKEFKDISNDYEKEVIARYVSKFGKVVDSEGENGD